MTSAATLPSDNYRAISRFPYQKSAWLSSLIESIILTLISFRATMTLSERRLARKTNENLPCPINFWISNPLTILPTKLETLVDWLTASFSLDFSASFGAAAGYCA